MELCDNKIYYRQKYTHYVQNIQIYFMYIYVYVTYKKNTM